MATAKKATKKVVAKKAIKKTAVKRVTKNDKNVYDDGVYYIVSQRNKLLGYTPVALFKSRFAAERLRNDIESMSILSFRAAKVDRVELVHDYLEGQAATLDVI